VPGTVIVAAAMIAVIVAAVVVSTTVVTATIVTAAIISAATITIAATVVAGRIVPAASATNVAGWVVGAAALPGLRRLALEADALGTEVDLHGRNRKARRKAGDGQRRKQPAGDERGLHRCLLLWPATGMRRARRG